MIKLIKDNLNLKLPYDKFIIEMESILLELGDINFSYVYLPYSLVESPDFFVIGNYDNNWVNEYRNKKYYKIDPVILLSSKTSSPFHWKHVIDCKNYSSLFELSANYGIEKGYSVPVHEPGSGFGCMHISSSKNDKSFEYRINKYELEILLIAKLSHDFLMRSINSSAEILTDREKECLSWVMKGKTYFETSIILGISERTVKFHMKNMTNKLNVNNSKQLVAKALSMSLIN